MKSLTVLVDLDDTLEELCDAWIKWLNAKYGTNVKHEEVVDWDVSKFFPSLSADKVYGVLSEEAFWKTVVPKDGAVEYLRRIVEDGHNVYIVTASHYLSIEAKTRYVLNTYFDFIPWVNVIITHNKHMIRGDVLIDDGIHNLYEGGYRKILMSAPHNKATDTSGTDIIRVSGWEEAYYTVRDIATENEPKVGQSYVKSADLCDRCVNAECPSILKNTPCSFRSKT